MSTQADILAAVDAQTASLAALNGAVNDNNVITQRLVTVVRSLPAGYSVEANDAIVQRIAANTETIKQFADALVANTQAAA